MKIRQYKKIIQEIALKSSLEYDLIHQIIQNFYTNLTKELNTFNHYNIYVKNLGYFVLSPKKIKRAIQVATFEEKQNKIDILNPLLQKAESRIQERIHKHNISRKINKERHVSKNKANN